MRFFFFMTCALWDQCSEICPRLQGVAKKEGMRGDFDVLHSAFDIRHCFCALEKQYRISNTEWKSVSLKKETPSSRSLKGFRIKSGIVLLSRTVAGIVPLAPRGLTSLFEMGRGVTPSILTPENSIEKRQERLSACPTFY